MVSTQNSDLFLLSVNAFFWLLLALYFVKKFGLKSLVSLFVIFYGLISAFAIHLYNTPQTPLYPWVGINPFALLYLNSFLLLFISLLPKNQLEGHQIVYPPAQYITPLYIFVIFFSLLSSYEVFSNFSDGLYRLMMDDNFGKELYEATTEKYVYSDASTEGVNLIGALGNIALGLAPVFLLIYLTTNNPNKFITIGLAIATFISYMHAISIGIRSAIIQNILSFSFIYIYLSPSFSPKTKRFIKPILITFFSLIFVGLSLITVSRFGDDNNSDNNALQSVESYACQSIIYFGVYGLDNGGQIRNGDRTFPLIKSVFCDDVARSSYDRRLAYTNMKINESVFSTFIGDFVFDFGPVGGAVVMLILYMIFKSFLRRRMRRIFIHNIIVIYAVIYLLCGFYLYPYTDFGGNILLICMLLLAIFYKSIFTWKQDTTIIAK